MKMGYTQKIAFYRAEFYKYLRAGDAENARINASMYARVVRALHDDPYGKLSYLDKAKLSTEIRKYEQIAAMISEQGINARVIYFVENGNVPPSAPAPVAPAVQPVAPAPTPVQTAPVQTPVSDSGTSNGEWSADMFDKYLSAVAVVNTKSGVGTGFFISSSGLMLTNHHVVSDGDRLESKVWIETGDSAVKCNMEILHADSQNDVALLQAQGLKRNVPFIPIIKDYALVRPGIDMMIIGNALDFGLAPISGTVKFAKSKYDGDLVFTAPTNKGDSGAPVINRNGECIGINKSSTEWILNGHGKIKANAIANATTAETILNLLTQWNVHV